MTAWQPPQGSREIDRIIPPLGRIRLRTGTKDARRAQAYDRMLDVLPLDALRLLQARVVSLREIYDKWSSGQPLPTADALRPLETTLAAWLDRPLKPVGASEQIAREKFAAKIRAAAAKDASLAALPALCRGIYLACRDDGLGATWNRRKANALAFLRDVVGKRSRIYEDIQALPALPEVPKFSRHPCTVGEARAIAGELGEKWGAVWWALCTTGMGPTEYWEDGWRVTSQGVEIHGQKRRARNRIVPLVSRIPAAPGAKDGFAEAVERADLGVTPRDARRTYARWLEEIGLPPYRRSAYMGHGPKSMRELYPWGEIRSWLADDARALAQYLGEKNLKLEASR